MSFRHKYNTIAFMTEILEKGINTPGLLVHGIDRPYPEVLQKILITEGLLPLYKQPTRFKRPGGWSANPDYVSLSMVGGLGGYDDTGTSLFWGASKMFKEYRITVIIDPTYLLDNISDFMAIGSKFDPSERSYHQFGDIGELLEYPKELRTNVYSDEVFANRVRTEGIIGMIIDRSYMKRLREDLGEINCMRNILLYDLQNKRHN